MPVPVLVKLVQAKANNLRRSIHGAGLEQYESPKAVHPMALTKYEENILTILRNLFHIELILGTAGSWKSVSDTLNKTKEMVRRTHFPTRQQKLQATALVSELSDQFWRAYENQASVESIEFKKKLAALKRWMMSLTDERLVEESIRSLMSTLQRTLKSSEFFLDEHREEFSQELNAIQTSFRTRSGRDTRKDAKESLESQTASAQVEAAPEAVGVGSALDPKRGSLSAEETAKKELLDATFFQLLGGSAFVHSQWVRANYYRATADQQKATEARPLLELQKQLRGWWLSWMAELSVWCVKPKSRLEAPQISRRALLEFNIEITSTMQEMHQVQLYELKDLAEFDQTFAVVDYYQHTGSDELPELSDALVVLSQHIQYLRRRIREKEIRIRNMVQALKEEE